MRGMSLGACFGLLALTSCDTPGSHQGLVGGGIDQVLDQLGPPLTSSITTSGLTMGYHGADGAVVEDAVCILDGVVVKTTEGLERNATPSGDLIVGSIEALVEQLGPIRSIAYSANSATVEWEQWEGAVYDGYVLAQRKS